jgi:tRNA(fMet)-specific endonuclease VapC
VSKFLLDTNICIYFLKGKFNLISKIEKIGLVNCFISEITVAELKYGAEKSEQIVENKKKVELLLNKFTVIPIYTSLDVYAKEKTKLSKAGNIIDDFDLLIGATALTNNLVLVTNNTKHFKRLKNLNVQDWTK